MSNWAIFGIFAVGYISRHLAGIWYNRIKKPASAELPPINADQVQDTVISYDRGKTWFIRSKCGSWVKASYSTVQKILDFYVNKNKQRADHQHTDATGVEEDER